MLLSGLLVLLPLLGGCTSSDPLTWADERYVAILADLNAARRDTTRNVFNKDARRREVLAEKAVVAFFRDARLMAAIDEARSAPEGTPARTRGDAWWRQAVYARSWTDAEKEAETELLERLDGVAGAEATWSPPTGQRRILLTGRWEDVSREADDLPEDLREDLAEAYVNHRMSMVGDTLKELVVLRNRVARREGFETWWHLSLYHRGLAEEMVDAVAQEVHPIIRPANHAQAETIAAEAVRRSLKNDFANTPSLRRSAGLDTAGDQAEVFFDTDLAEHRMVTTLRGMGIELPGLQVYTGPSRTTLAGAYSFPIHLPDLTALVVSLDRRYDLWFYEALFHEAGYAFWWRNIGAEAQASPVVWEVPSPWMEGFAQVFERILYEPAWAASQVPDMPPEVASALAVWRRGEAVRNITEAIVDTQVERRAYSDPNNWAAVARYCTDIETVYEVYAGTPVHTEGGVPYCEALLSPLIWHYPAYAQNYVFSAVTEATLYDAVVRNVGAPVGNGRVGPWLVENVVKEGGLVPFPTRLEQLSGTKDRAAAFRAYVEGK